MNKHAPIYLDNHATTKVDIKVLNVMLPYFNDIYGNASSKNHHHGNTASESVENSREIISKTLNAKSSEIIFTSGSTESINLAIKGIAEYSKSKSPHFITAATEHKATLDCFHWIQSQGFEVTILPVDSSGFINLDELEASIKETTVLVSIMAANNEIGTIQPLEEIGLICRKKNCYFMTDATQAIGKIEIDVEKMNIDLLAFSGHKIHGPKGIGCLFVRRSNPHVYLKEQIHGGKHERSMRSGTLNVPGIVGLAKAVEIAVKEKETTAPLIKELRDCLENSLLTQIKGSKINGPICDARLINNLNIYLPGVEAEALIIKLSKHVSFSTGSACTTANIQPSHVLEAIGLKDEKAYQSVRFGLSKYTTKEEINKTSELIINTNNELLNML